MKSPTRQRPSAGVHFRAAFGREPDVLASAPGRVEFIGNHTDYNGGLVLGAALDLRVEVALGRRPDRQIHLRSAGRLPVQAELDRITPLDGASAWANYPLGVFALMQQTGADASVGFNLAVTSSIPSGAGLSSSAAFELATACALTAVYEVSFDRLDLVHLCRRAENEFVGVPCGLLDQGVSAFGREDHLVLVDSRKATFEAIEMPPGTAFWIFNSHHAHTLAGSLYAQRHDECMEARHCLAAFYGGLEYLTDLSPDEVERHRHDLPPDLFKRALHVTAEHARVREMVGCLKGGDLQAAGRLLFASHESSRTLFENSTPALDFLVQELGRQPHVYGARLTGGGFGGAAMAWTDARFSQEQAEAVRHAYEAAFDGQLSVLPCRTADGAGLL